MSDNSNSPDTSVTTSRPVSAMSEIHGGAVLDPAKSRIHESTAAHPNYAHGVSPFQQPLSPLSASTTSMVGVPTGPRAITGNHMRSRGLSRSSSDPNMVRHIINAKRSNKENKNNDYDDSQPNSLPLNGGEHVSDTSTRHSTSSVKHLTCFWWKEKGHCRFNDDDCLYAHHDTGHYTEPPRQLIPGEPALAGRKLDRAMRSLAIAAQQSSSSMNSVPGSRYPTRPSTPVIHSESGTSPSISFSASLNSPNVVLPQYNNDIDLARLNSDNQFLRNLVDQGNKEKAALHNIVEAFQAENKGLKGELEGLRKAQEQLLAEREGLHNRINKLESEQYQSFSAAGIRSVSSPFGTIGRGRVNTETRYLGGLLSED